MNTEIINCGVMVVWEEIASVTSVKSCLTAFLLLLPCVGGTWKERTEIQWSNWQRLYVTLEISLLKGIYLWYLCG